VVMVVEARVVCQATTGMFMHTELDCMNKK